jgi:HK97 family phage prohead protease
MHTTMAPIDRKNIEYFPIRGIEMKAVGSEAQGVLEGYLNVKNVRDLGDDITRDGCFLDTIAQAYRRKSAGDPGLWPYLYNHSTAEIPPGLIVEADETARGLWTRVQLNMDMERGRDLFHAFRQGSLTSQSMGYIASSVNWLKESGKSIRELLVVSIKEGSATIFPMNTDSRVTSVKRYWPGYSAKGQASGKTSWPLAERGVSWDKGQARRDIAAYATSGDTIDWSKVASCHFWVAKSPPSTWEDCKFPFVAKVGGEMKAVPAAIFNGAARLSSANIDDKAGVQAKMTTYYRKMKMPPPWEKGSAMSVYTKDFDSRYAAETLDDWLYADFQDVVSALRAAIQDCFSEGSDPVANLEDDVLPQLAAALRAYVQQGVELGYEPSSQDSYAMMSAGGAGESKAGYIAAKPHSDAIAAVNAIEKHVKVVKRALSSVGSSSPAARAGQLAGWPVYGSMSEPRDYFAQKEAEEDLALQLKLINTGLSVDAMLREGRETLQEQSPLGQLDGAMEALRTNLKHLDSANSKPDERRDADVLTVSDRLRIEKMSR